MNGSTIAYDIGMPFKYMSATPTDVSVIVEPDKWIVAQSGTTKLATPSSTLFAFAWRSVTGIVAADDCVPMAVK